MTFFERLVLSLVALMTTAACSAQQHFPLRSGEWTASTPDPSHPGGQPTAMLFCMDDATWTKALNANPNCSIQQFNLTSKGASYSMSCPSKPFPMKGDFKVSFDGMTHMISSGTIEMTINGKTSQTSATTDFRWKGPVCNPNADINLRDHSRPPQ